RAPGRAGGGRGQPGGPRRTPAGVAQGRRRSATALNGELRRRLRALNRVATCGGITVKKHASAVWQGNLKEGKGHLSTQSGALKDNPYGFNTRFEDQPGTNPEELLGAAHAGCFS